MAHIFIDTNVLLSFYAFTQDDLTRLEQLAELGEHGAFVILTTSHIQREYKRNREAKIAESLKEMKTQHLDMRLPRLCDPYDETDELRRLAREYRRVHGALLERIDEDARNAALRADHLVARFFAGATRLDLTDAIIGKARVRVELGNPPGKRGSLGDAVNWETLLAFRPPDQLLFVTDDADFYSPLDSSQPREYLTEDWEDVVGHPITFVHRLSELPAPVPQDVLPVDDVPDEVDNLIFALQVSGNFAHTHAVIAQLAVVPRFTPRQARELVAALDNDQVSWIINDDDVRGFYERLLQEHGADLQAEELRRLQEALTPPQALDEAAEDIPF